MKFDYVPDSCSWCEEEFPEDELFLEAGVYICGECLREMDIRMDYDTAMDIKYHALKDEGKIK